MQLSLGLTPVSSVALDLPTFLELESGDVLVSPEGNVFTYYELVDEIVAVEEPTDEEGIVKREFHIRDTGKTLRKMTFHNGVSVYGILISSYGKVSDSTGIQKKVGIDYDEEYNAYVDDECGWYTEEAED